MTTPEPEVDDEQSADLDDPNAAASDSDENPDELAGEDVDDDELDDDEDEDQAEETSGA